MSHPVWWMDENAKRCFKEGADQAPSAPTINEIIAKARMKVL